MKNLIAPGLALVLVTLDANAAPTAEQARAALADAQKAEAAAIAAKAAWVPTEAALARSRKALASARWEEAFAAAQEARDLARLSVEQAEEQKTAWRSAVYR
jgi:hypothetical protein